MPELELRLLDPTTDIELFREAYEWRNPKKHAQPDRAPFEAFIATDPKQIVVGVFNGHFCAAFLLYEYKPGHFEAHFTSKRGAPRESLIEGGKLIRDAFLQNGAQELCAWIIERNTALMGYLDALGFRAAESKRFAGQNDTGGGTLPSNASTEARTFVKYVCQKGDSP